MKIIHICDGWEPFNGAANIARMIAGEQAAKGAETALCRWVGVRELRAADEVWIHCGWKPCLWWAALWAKKANWMPEACYDPLRLAYHGWKKRLAGPIERWALRRCERIVATCKAEAEWIRAYEPRAKNILVMDLKRFFGAAEAPSKRREGPLHLLYLGRRHPLKGVEYLESAVERIDDVELKIVSGAKGAELERVWDWCDVLVLPTLSDNFGLVVAEALERGKRVITTDGAPAWRSDDYDGRLVYLEGYREGTAEKRVQLLREAIGREMDEK